MKASSVRQRAGRRWTGVSPKTCLSAHFLSPQAVSVCRNSIGQKWSPFELNLQWPCVRYGSSEMSFAILNITVCVFKNKMVQNSKIKMVHFFEKPTNEKLFCGLTMGTGSKYIKIFYPIICFDQLTTILKIQSWSSWQVQLPNFI